MNNSDKRGAVMGVDFSKSHRAMDANQHEGSYTDFVKLMVAGSVVVVMTLVGMAIFLT